MLKKNLNIQKKIHYKKKYHKLTLKCEKTNSTIKNFKHLNTKNKMLP